MSVYKPHAQCRYACQAFHSQTAHMQYTIKKTDLALEIIFGIFEIIDPRQR